MKEREKFAESNIYEGIVSFRAVVDAINAGNSDRRIVKVFYDKEKAKKRPKELSFLKAKSYEQNFVFEITDQKTIDEMTLGTNHGGIAFVCTERNYPNVQKDSIKENGFYVVLDGIEDPYNFGYALRSIYASGADGIVLPKRNWLGVSGVVCRASAGASEKMPVFIYENEDFVDIFKAKGYRLVCSDIENSVSMYEYDLKKPILLVVGGEKRGISSSLLKKADGIVRIEYGVDTGFALSAASASTVLSFEILRQNKTHTN